MQARESPVQNIRRVEAALHREWQQLSQHDIRRLTGGMRRRVEAVIQARGGYTSQERNGDLLGHYIGCKKPHKKIKKNVNLMNI
jgi:hypothetical protein